MLVSPFVSAKEIDVAIKPTQDLKTAAEGLKCPQNEYQSQQNPSAPPISGCQQCQAKLRETFGNVDSAVAGGVTKDRSIAAAGTGITKNISGAANGKQDNSMNSENGVQNAGKQAQGERSANAKQVAAAFEKCKSDIQSSCQESQLGNSDKKPYSQAKQACEEGAKESNAVAAEKAGSGMDMGQLGQMAQQLAQGLGSMMQKKGGEKENATPTDSSAASISAPPEATMGSSKPDGALQTAQSATFDNMDGAKVADIGKNGTAFSNGTNGTGAAPAASQSYDSGGAGSSGESGTIGSDPRGGGGMAGGLGASGGGAGSGGGSSSGASTFDPNAAAAKAAAGGQDANGAYEIAGGGSGSRFLGLRSKSGDLSDLDGALGTESGGAGMDLASLGNDAGGDRGLASEGEAQNADIHDDGSSLFNVVRSKLVEIKKRGNI